MFLGFLGSREAQNVTNFSDWTSGSCFSCFFLMLKKRLTCTCWSFWLEWKQMKRGLWFFPQYSIRLNNWSEKGDFTSEMIVKISFKHCCHHVPTILFCYNWSHFKMCNTVEFMGWSGEVIVVAKGFKVWLFYIFVFFIII